jgi:CDP-glucose 4,6-dehydratase
MADFVDEVYLNEALARKRVLVTGHTGFKGAWLSLWLRRLGAHVVGVSLPAQEPSMFNAIGLDRLIDSRVGDIRTKEGFRKAIGNEDFDLVIHMAAQAIVRTSYEDPIDTYQTNVMGTAIVLEAARRMPSLKGVIVVTSDKCYENREWVWGYREQDPMGGKDPYSSSKGCAELVTSAYRRSFFSNPEGPQLASVRAGNVFGGGDWGVDRLIPDLMRSAETGVPARIRNPRNVRPWQHVLEPVRGYLMLAARLIDTGAGFAGGWNFGPDRDAAVDVVTLADMVMDKWGDAGPQYLVDRQANAPAEAVILRLDSTKANVELGWKPILSLDQAVSMTVGWHLRYTQDRGSITQFSQQQIAEYAAAWAVNRERSINPVNQMKVPVCA